MVTRIRPMGLALALGATALTVSLALLGVPGGTANDPTAYRAHHGGRRLTADNDIPALAPRLPRLARARQLPVVTVRVGAGVRGIAVPRSFFGLSTEYWDLPRYERRLRVFERLLDDVHAHGDAPTVIRVGGDSADFAYWKAIDRVTPRRAYELTPLWLQRTRQLVRSADLRLIIDLNLVANSTAMAVKWAAAATAALPRGTITGFEIGNEPDVYHWYYRNTLVGKAGRKRPIALGHFSAGDYARGFGAYARALARVARGVPILGPAVANPTIDVGWISRLLARQRRAVGTVTAHRYPLSQCAAPWSPRLPTVSRLLSERSSAGMARSFRAAVDLAHRAGLRFRLTELNSVTCGGTLGVSDTFGTALWAPDALFELMRNRVDGVNVHIRDDSINAPFILSRSSLQIRPLFYGFITFVHALGPGARLLPSYTDRRPGVHLKAWVVKIAGPTAHVLLINKGRRAANVDLRLPARRPATVERLLAPSVSARFGVTFAGQKLDQNAAWQDAHVAEHLTRGRYGYRVAMPGTSAALVTVPLAPSRSTHRPRRRTHSHAHRR